MQFSIQTLHVLEEVFIMQQNRSLDLALNPKRRALNFGGLIKIRNQSIQAIRAGFSLVQALSFKPSRSSEGVANATCTVKPRVHPAIIAPISSPTKP